MNATSTCAGCGDPIFWRATASGKQMSLNPEPRPAWFHGAQSLVGDYNCKPAVPMLDASPFYEVHWVTCSRHDQLRKKDGER